MQKLVQPLKRYESFRWFFTSAGALVIGGKSEQQNEVVLREFLKPTYTVMHTTEPGSPFMIIQTEKPSKKDLEETAIVCAAFSQQWKKSGKEISVDSFLGSQLYKTRLMKVGTFGVRGVKKTMTVNPSLTLVMQKGIVRAVPASTKEEKLAEITRGSLTKEAAAEKLAKKLRDIYHFPVSKEEIMQAIPSDKLSVK